MHLERWEIALVSFVCFNGGWLACMFCHTFIFPHLVISFH